MVSRAQAGRSYQTAVRPTSRPPGELHVNYPDRQLSAVDSGAAAVDLIAVRYFSDAASYVTGDLVAHNGAVWAAKQDMTGLGFDLSLWSNIVPDLTPYYLKTGGAITGPVTLSGPTATLDVSGAAIFREPVSLLKTFEVAGVANAQSVNSHNGSFTSKAVAGQNAHYWMSDPAGTAFACVYGTPVNANLNFAYGSMAKTFVLRGSDGAAIAPNEIYALNAYKVWHAGNLNPGVYLPLSGGTLTGNVALNPGGISLYNGNVDIYHGRFYGNINGSYGDYGVVGRAGTVNHGGVIGYNQATNIYGIVGANANSFVGQGPIYVGGAGVFTGAVNVASLQAASTIRTEYRIYAQDSYNSTTSISPNLVIAQSGGLIRSTSSLAVKTGVEPLLPHYGNLILKLKPIFFRSKLKDDRPDWSHFGFGAEDVAAVDPRFASWDRDVLRDKDGNPQRETKEVEVPELTKDRVVRMVKKTVPGDTKLGSIQPQGINLNAIVAALVELVQRQQARIEALEGKQS